MSDRQHDSLSQFFDLLVQASDISVLLRRLFLKLHGLDPRVILSRQLLQQNIGVLINANQLSRPEFRRIDKSRHREEDGIPGAGLDDNAFILGFLIQIDLSLIIDLGLDIEYLDDIGDQPRQLLVLLDLGAVVLEGFINLLHVVVDLVAL